MNLRTLTNEELWRLANVEGKTELEQELLRRLEILMDGVDRRIEGLEYDIDGKDSEIRHLEYDIDDLEDDVELWKSRFKELQGKFIELRDIIESLKIVKVS